MKQLLLFLSITLLSLVGCKQTISGAIAKPGANKAEKVWIFAQFNVPEEGEKIESYYYYGLITQSLYKEIKENRAGNAFITLEKVRYWGKEGKIHEYADNEFSGEIVFRVEDIRKIQLINVEPKIGLGSEQFDNNNQAEKQVKSAVGT